VQLALNLPQSRIWFEACCPQTTPDTWAHRSAATVARKASPRARSAFNGVDCLTSPFALISLISLILSPSTKSIFIVYHLTLSSSRSFLFWSRLLTPTSHLFLISHLSSEIFIYGLSCRFSLPLCRFAFLLSTLFYALQTFCCSFTFRLLRLLPASWLLPARFQSSATLGHLPPAPLPGFLLNAPGTPHSLSGNATIRRLRLLTASSNKLSFPESFSISIVSDSRRARKLISDRGMLAEVVRTELRGGGERVRVW
jgi:hypothetical protein